MDACALLMHCRERSGHGGLKANNAIALLAGAFGSRESFVQDGFNSYAVYSSNLAYDRQRPPNVEYVSAQSNHQQQTAADRSRQQQAAAHSSQQQQAGTRQFQNLVCSLLEIDLPQHQCARLRRPIGSKEKGTLSLDKFCTQSFCVGAI